MNDNNLKEAILLALEEEIEAAEDRIKNLPKHRFTNEQLKMIEDLINQAESKDN